MSYQFFLSLISAISIGVSGAYLGSLMLQKRMALVSGPLGHLAFPGVALALLYGFDISLGAFPFIILGIIFIWYLENKTKIAEEALTAIVFAGGVALALLFLPMKDAEEALTGNIMQISAQSAFLTFLLSFLVFLVIKKIAKKMILINISEDLAKVEGVNVRKYNFIYLLAIAIIVALGVKLVGVLLTVALTAIPPATAKNLAVSMKSYFFYSLFFGVVSPIIGLLIFQFSHLPAGVLIILVNTFFFFCSVFGAVAKHHHG